MIANPLFRDIYQNLASVYSKERTARKSDLERLLGLPNSFCVYSPPRNGITTLLKEYVRTVGGIYVDCQCLSQSSAIEELSAKAGNGNFPLVLDEAVVMFKRVGDHNACIDLIQRVIGVRQLGLRLSSESDNHQTILTQRGFEIIRVNKITYDEFKLIFDLEFNKINFPFPERFIQFGHRNYDLLAESVWYVAEAFRLLVEESKSDLSEEEVRESVEEKYYWFGSRKRQIVYRQLTTL